MYFIASAAPGVNATQFGLISQGLYLCLIGLLFSAVRFFAASLCAYLALRFAGLVLPFVLYSPYRWILQPLSLLMITVGGFVWAKKRRDASGRASSTNISRTPI